MKLQEKQQQASTTLQKDPLMTKFVKKYALTTICFYHAFTWIYHIIYLLAKVHILHHLRKSVFAKVNLVKVIIFI